VPGPAATSLTAGLVAAAAAAIAVIAVAVVLLLLHLLSSTLVSTPCPASGWLACGQRKVTAAPAPAFQVADWAVPTPAAALQPVAGLAAATTALSPAFNPNLLLLLLLGCCCCFPRADAAPAAHTARTSLEILLTQTIH